MWTHDHVGQLIRTVAFLVGSRMYCNRGAENALLRIHTLRITAAERLSAWLLTWCEQPASPGPYLMCEELELAKTAIDEFLKRTLTPPEQLTLRLGFGREFLDSFGPGPLKPVLPSRIIAFHWGVLLMRGAVDPNTSAEALHALLKRLDQLVPEVNLSIVACELGRPVFKPSDQLRAALAEGVQACEAIPDANERRLSEVRLCDGLSAIANERLHELNQLLVT